MRAFRLHPRRCAEGGFSMVEMLIAAFVLAVGILGLTMLQVMSIRTAKGSKNLTTATQLAEHIMDRVELEARLSWLEKTQSNLTAPTELTNLTYLGKKVSDKAFNILGLEPNAKSTRPEEKSPFFTVSFVQSLEPAASIGRVSDCTVTVKWMEQVDRAGKPVPRTVTLVRRYVHG